MADDQLPVSNDIIQEILFRIEQLDKKIDVKTEELYRSLGGQIDRLGSSIQGEFRRIDSEIQSSAGEISSLKTEVGKLKSDVTRIDGESKSIKSDLGSLQGRFTTLELGTTTLKGKVETLEKGNYDSRLKTIETSIQKIPILEGNVKNNTDRVEALEKKVDGKIKDLEGENGQWKENFDTYWKEHGDMIAHKDGELVDLKDEWEADKKQHELDITDIKQKAKEKEDGLNRDIEGHKTKVNELEVKNGNLDSSLTTTETDRDNWKSRFEELEKTYIKDKVVK